MKLWTFSDYENLSCAAAEQILSDVTGKGNLVICMATGSSPKRLYEIFAGQSDTTLFDSVSLVKVDEWGGLEGANPVTCEAYLRRRVLEPLHISENRYIGFKGDAADPVLECQRIQAQLEKVGGIDISILGLGLNGHLAFNEPSEALQANVHVAQLTEQTRHHSMLKSGSVKPSWGYTLGMVNILQSRKIILLVSGESKVDPLQRLMEPKIATDFPASFLWLHPDVTIYSDVA